LPAKPQPEPKGGSIKIPESVNEFYANAFTALVTRWDVVLLFGSTTLPSTIKKADQVGGEITIQGEVRMDTAIRMSPQHAKACSAALQSMVARWEEEFGTISVPPEEKTVED